MKLAHQTQSFAFSPVVWRLIVATAALALAACGEPHDATPANKGRAEVTAGKAGDNLIRVQGDQITALAMAPVGEQRFNHLHSAVGVIDFNQDKQVAVLPAYQGRVNQVQVKAGDDVKAGQVLYTLQVPDLAQATTALISAQAVRKNTQDILTRARHLSVDDSIAKKELQQSETDAQTAEVNFQAARKSLKLFGLTEEQINAVEQQRLVDIEMAVRSPIAGRVTTRQVQPGLIVQPNSNPAPITVADMHSLWMVASVPEAEIGAYRLGQRVTVRVPAYPGRSFTGKLNYIADAVDPATRRLGVRAEITDGTHELKPQMSADFYVETAAAEVATAVPVTALVRESDGSFNVWVLVKQEDDSATLKRRAVTLGAQENGYVQIKSGLTRVDTVAQKNALFLSNLYSTDTN